jgi:hypothetical protein
MLESEPVRTQRNETAVRWFLLGLLDPADRRAALEREQAFNTAQVEHLQTVADKLDAQPGPQPFRPTVEIGLRFGAVVEQWLREQLDAVGGDAD